MRTRYDLTAPFHSYNKTDSQAYQDGVDSARSWRSHWNHKPGGPYVSKYDPRSDLADPDWIAYCETTARHCKLWLEGWHDGMKRYHPAQLKAIVSKMVYDKLAA